MVAKWEPIVYEIRYDKNATDATGSMQFHSCKYDWDCELKDSGFERIGYKFVGWSTTTDGKAEYSSDTTMTVKNLTSIDGERITLYAIWKVVIGDVDADGLINTADTRYIRNHITGTDILNGDRLLAADVNQDGVVDFVDMQVMWMYYAGGHGVDELPYKTETKFTIMYNLNNGIVSGYNPTEYISGSDIPVQNPTREGYLFLGWTGSNGKKVQTDLIISKETTGNLTYTANWISLEDIPEVPTIVLAYPQWTSVGIYAGVFEMCESGAYNYQNKPVGAELYAKTDSGYTLIDSVTNGCGFDFQLNPGETKVYTARVYINYDENNKVYSNYSNELIIQNENIITYDLDGGINSPNNKNGYSSDYPYQRELEAPTKAGYKFLGWTGSNGETPELEVSIPLDVTGHLHYVANWELTDEAAIDKTIPLAPTIVNLIDTSSLHISGVYQGLFEVNATEQYDGVELYEKTNDSYVFINEFDKLGLASFEVNPGESKVYTARVYTFDENNNKVYSNYSNEVLVKNENIITYDLNGGVNSDNNTIGYAGHRNITLEVPTKDGYTFLGWTGSNGDIPQLEVTIPHGTTGHLHYVANWKIEE